MAETHDDLDAIRTIVDALSPFEKEAQMRIIRWAFEKLGISIGTTVPTSTIHSPTVEPLPPLANQYQAPTLQSPLDIKSFVKLKAPASDMQFAATIAYFYAFEALEEHKKSEIGSGELQEACRLVGRERLTNPGQTLRNAAFNGLLDKGSEKGTYKINTVGENLVALTLPSGVSTTRTNAPKKRAKKKSPSSNIVKKAAKKAPKKSASKK